MGSNHIFMEMGGNHIITTTSNLMMRQMTTQEIKGMDVTKR